MVPPAELYRVVRRYANPFDLASHEPVIQRLKEEREADLRRALAIAPLHSSAGADAWLLPDAAWSRRVSGTFANRLARDDSARAHAVVTPASGDAYVVSLRSPREGGLSASEFCRRFGAGGGRAVAAGIDRLPRSDLPRLLDALDETWGVRPQSLG
jgi:hypothetical protein